MSAVEQLLIVDDDTDYLDAVKSALSRDFDVRVASDPEHARTLCDGSVNVVLLDVRLSSTASNEGLDLLDWIKATHPDLPVVMMTAYADIDVAVGAMRRGASDFVQKAHVDIRELRKVVRGALQRVKLERRVADLEEDLHRLEPWELVGEDAALQGVRTTIDLVARDGQCTVLILGETGTGKELVARAIHSRGVRKEGPFVVVSVPTLPANLVESELFGHRRGAFTDAKEQRIGYVEKANRGVLFLDEIGEMTLESQLKLLRFVETKRFARLGASDEIAVDVQIVCATNRNLEQAIRQGLFREDLYFRLKTMSIELPPLRARSADVPLLVDHFLFLFRQQGRTRLAGIGHDALATLIRYRFPGNVRELRAVVERAVILAQSKNHSLIEVDDLPLEVQQGSPAQDTPTIGEGFSLDRALARTELSFIQTALQETDGRKTEAWRLLGLNDRFALRRRVKQIEVSYPDLMADFSLVKALYVE